jgi:hypothetical protein
VNGELSNRRQLAKNPSFSRLTALPLFFCSQSERRIMVIVALAIPDAFFASSD